MSMTDVIVPAYCVGDTILGFKSDTFGTMSRKTGKPYSLSSKFLEQQMAIFARQIKKFQEFRSGALALEVKGNIGDVFRKASFLRAEQIISAISETRTKIVSECGEEVPPLDFHWKLICVPESCLKDTDNFYDNINITAFHEWILLLLEGTVKPVVAGRLNVDGKYTLAPEFLKLLEQDVAES